MAKLVYCPTVVEQVLRCCINSSSRWPNQNPKPTSIRVNRLTATHAGHFTSGVIDSTEYYCVPKQHTGIHGYHEIGLRSKHDSRGLASSQVSAYLNVRLQILSSCQRYHGVRAFTYQTSIVLRAPAYVFCDGSRH